MGGRGKRPPLPHSDLYLRPRNYLPAFLPHQPESHRKKIPAPAIPPEVSLEPDPQCPEDLHYITAPPPPPETPARRASGTNLIHPEGAWGGKELNRTSSEAYTPRDSVHSKDNSKTVPLWCWKSVGAGGDQGLEESRRTRTEPSGCCPVQLLSLEAGHTDQCSW